MHKRLNAYFAGGWILAAVLSTAFVALPTTSQAFCVCNNSNKGVEVSQQNGPMFGKFVQWIKPGKRACCNWENDDCNPGGKKTSEVKFRVTAPLTIGSNQTLCTRTIKAGGWLTISGKHPDVLCKPHF